MCSHDDGVEVTLGTAANKVERLSENIFYGTFVFSM